jgi:hypothetical protein
VIRPSGLGEVGDKLGMDSTLLASNLATCTRLQRISACLQPRLNEADRALVDRLCTKRPSQIIHGLEETTKKAWREDPGEMAAAPAPVLQPAL